MALRSIRGQVGGDSSLFEVGCYFYLRIDLWLLENAPEHRQSISASLAEQFTALYGKALGRPDIDVLFNERASRYGALLRSGADTAKLHEQLMQLLPLTQHNAPPLPYDFEDAPILVNDVFSDWALRVALGGFEVAYLSRFLDRIPVYIDSTT